MRSLIYFFSGGCQPFSKCTEFRVRLEVGHHGPLDALGEQCLVAVQKAVRLAALPQLPNGFAPVSYTHLDVYKRQEHADVKRTVEEYQTKYQRVVYKKIENKGIAANTNAAAELAAGEYLALADHDDILAPHALYTMGKAILQLRQRGEPDGFLYSDEALFTKSIQRPMVAHFKPDSEFSAF